MNTLTLFVLALFGVLVFSGVAAWLWRRFYRDDSQNIARRVFKNSTVPLVTRLVVRALDLIFWVVLYSLLDGVEIGPYVFGAFVVVQIFGTVSEFGLGVLLMREVARDRDQARHLFGITLLLRWLLVLALVPLAWLLIGGYDLLAAFGLGDALNPMEQQIIWILLLTLIPASYSGAVTALYNASERMEVPALTELITAVVSMLVRISLLLLGFGILGLAWAAVVVTSMTALAFLWLQQRDFFPPTLQWDGSQARHLLWLALPLMLNNLLSVFFFRIDIMVIRAIGTGVGPLLVTQYNAAYQILNVALILPPVITFAVFPMLSRHAQDDRAALAHAQNRTLHMLLLLAFPIAMGMCLLAPDLIRLFTRANADQYLPISAHVLAILAWFLPLSFANGLLQYVLIAVNRQHAITKAFVAGALFNLIANILTVPTFGLYAASITTILSEVVLFLVFWPLLRREGLTPPLLRLSWRPALAAGMMGLAMLLAMLLAGTVGWLLAALVAPPVYGVALWLLGGLGSEELALARRVLGRGPPA